VSTPDYLIIGTVTRDLVPGGFRIGGTGAYAALAARALGCRVAILTSAGDDLPLATYLDGIELRVVPAAQSTVFENIYTPAGRRQYLRSTAAHLTAADVPPAWRKARIVHLGPLAQDLDPALVDLFPSETLVGVTPQGWLRQWDGAGLVSRREWLEAPRILARADAMVLSLEDVGNDETILHRYLSMARLAVVTRGWRGATVFQQGHGASYPAFQVAEVDPTGAGDVFAAAFFVGLAETGDSAQAARFANAAASFAIEGEGVSTIACRAAVEERLLHGALRQEA